MEWKCIILLRVELSDRMPNKLNINLSCFFFPRTFDTVAAQISSINRKTPTKILILFVLMALVAATKYEIQKPSTSHATVYRRKFWVDISCFSPCVINLWRNRDIYCGLKKAVPKSRARVYFEQQHLLILHDNISYSAASTHRWNRLRLDSTKGQRSEGHLFLYS